jgi:hypothetical protein
MVNSLLFVNATTNAIITSSESTATMYIQCREYFLFHNGG